MYDRQCEKGHIRIDLMEPVTAPEVFCAKCGSPSSRIWTGKAPGVKADEIPGGVWIKHGLCNEDGSPRKYYSHSEMAEEAKRRGVVNVVEHVTEPGTDKNPHTVKWTGSPAETMGKPKEVTEADLWQ